MDPFWQILFGRIYLLKLRMQISKGPEILLLSMGTRYRNAYILGVQKDVHILRDVIYVLPFEVELQ